MAYKERAKSSTVIPSPWWRMRTVCTIYMCVCLRGPLCEDGQPAGQNDFSSGSGFIYVCDNDFIEHIMVDAEKDE